MTVYFYTKNYLEQKHVDESGLMFPVVDELIRKEKEYSRWADHPFVYHSSMDLVHSLKDNKSPAVRSYMDFITQNEIDIPGYFKTVTNGAIFGRSANFPKIMPSTMDKVEGIDDITKSRIDNVHVNAFRNILSDDFIEYDGDLKVEDEYLVKVLDGLDWRNERLEEMIDMHDSVFLSLAKRPFGTLWTGKEYVRYAVEEEDQVKMINKLSRILLNKEKKLMDVNAFKQLKKKKESKEQENFTDLKNGTITDAEWGKNERKIKEWFKGEARKIVDRTKDEPVKSELEWVRGVMGDLLNNYAEKYYPSTVDLVRSLDPTVSRFAAIQNTRGNLSEISSQYNKLSAAVSKKDEDSMEAYYTTEDKYGYCPQRPSKFVRYLSCDVRLNLEAREKYCY